jgi:hypothetical protein
MHQHDAHPADVPSIELPGQRLSRRTVFKWFAATAAAIQLGDFSLAPGAEAPAAGATPFPPVVKGYGTDPKLNATYNPGDFWPLTLSVAQRRAATALADVIIPADKLGPAASAVRVPDFIDEWVSAPYPNHQKDRELIVPGLAWLDAESRKRFAAVFAELKPEQQAAICDDICSIARAQVQFAKPAAFFSRFRGMAAGAYYATPEGWRAIGYVGNIPLPSFDGPPPEVLARLGVEQTVK